MIELTVPDEALDVLRPLFVSVEGSCESWSDEEVVRRILIRGAMQYAKSAGLAWEEVQGTAASLRSALS